MNNEQGFAFPIVLFFAALFLITITHTIKVYVNEQSIYESNIELMRMEVLQLNAKEHLIKEPVHVDRESEQFIFPDGTVRIHFYKMVKERVVVHYEIETELDNTFNRRQYMTPDSLK